MVLLLVAGLCRCAGDPKAATNENFRAAIQQALDGQPMCLPLSFPAFAPQQSGPGDRHEQLAALRAAGLLEAPHPVPVQASIIDGWSRSTYSGATPGLQYDLSRQGKTYQRTVTPPFEQPQTRLCYAVPQVIDIVRYTEPASFLGRIVTHVTYEYRLPHLAAWAQQPAVVQAFSLQPNLALLNHSQTAEKTLLLASDGWRSAP